MAEVVNELGLVDGYVPDPKPDPNFPQPGRETCSDGRAFTQSEREAFVKSILGPPRDVPWIIQGDVTVAE